MVVVIIASNQLGKVQKTAVEPPMLWLRMGNEFCVSAEVSCSSGMLQWREPCAQHRNAKRQPFCIGEILLTHLSGGQEHWADFNSRACVNSGTLPDLATGQLD